MLWVRDLNRAVNTHWAFTDMQTPFDFVKGTACH